MAGWLDIGLINIQHIIYTPFKDWTCGMHTLIFPLIFFGGKQGCGLKCGQCVSSLEAHNG
jgi:hypothetical protein